MVNFKTLQNINIKICYVKHIVVQYTYTLVISDVIFVNKLGIIIPLF